MPKVGNKEFSYSPKGKAMAAKESAKTGKPMQTYKSGGKVIVRGTGAATQGIYARGPMG